MGGQRPILAPLHRNLEGHSPSLPYSLFHPCAAVRCDNAPKSRMDGVPPSSSRRLQCKTALRTGSIVLACSLPSGKTYGYGYEFYFDSFMYLWSIMLNLKTIVLTRDSLETLLCLGLGWRVLTSLPTSILGWLIQIEQAMRVATRYAPAPLLPRGRPSASRAAEQTQRSSSFPRLIRSHGHRCTRLTP